MRLRNQYFDKPAEGVAVTPVAETAAVPAETPKPAEATPVVEPVVVKPAETPAATPKPDWKDARIAKLTHDLNEERRLRAAAPTETPKPGETDANFQARVDEAANARAAQIAAQADWDRQTGAVMEKGNQEFADFPARVKAITASVNIQDPAELAAYNAVVAGAIETGEAHKVIYALGADPGEFQRLMKLTPVKRAMELGKMAVGLVSDKEPSNLPKPITPINSTGDHYNEITPDDPKRGDKLSTKEWMRRREAQAKEKGIQ